MSPDAVEDDRPDPSGEVIAGGTNLIDLMKEDVEGFPAGADISRAARSRER